MKTLYFVRHGQSQANVDGRYAGWSDSPLTDKGKQQATAAAEAARNLGVQKIVSSDLARAYDTACIIADALGIERSHIVQTPKLREVNVGKLTGEPESGVPGTPHANRHGYSYYSRIKDNPMGVEHLDDLRERLVEFVQELRGYPEETILLVGHDISGLMLQQVLQSTHEDIFELQPFPNAEIFKMYQGELA